MNTTVDAAALPPAGDAGAIGALGDAFRSAVGAVESAWALLRAELRLARSSALALVWLGFALVFLGVGAWLATSVALGALLYWWLGNFAAAAGGIALANLVGGALVLAAMRRCWHDLSLPRTRGLVAGATAPPA
jgi:hypothetical protein